MWFLIKKWFNKLPLTSKVITVAFVALFFYAGYLAIRLARTEYKLWKEIKNDYIEAQKIINEKEKEEEKIIKQVTKRNQKKRKQNNEINEKLKQDEKVIDNSDVTNDDRKRYLSKYKE